MDTEDARAWTPEDAKYAHKRMEAGHGFDCSQEPDVVIVGAGFAGLLAANVVQSCGLKTVLLEAADRVGGRSHSFRLSNNGISEFGATWINKTTQSHVYELIKRYDLETFQQKTGGYVIFEDHNGAIHRIPDDEGFGPLKPATADKVTEIFNKIEEGASKLDPSSWAKIHKNDDVSFHQWAVDEGLYDDPFTKALISHYASAAIGVHPEEVSVEFMFNWVRSCGGLVAIGSEGKLGAQSLKIRQGTSAIAKGLATSLLAGTVIIESPVNAIKQHENGCIVTTSNGRQFKAKKVILAVPPTAYHHIQFVPPLPSAKREVISNLKGGHFTKIILTYTQPWWREAGWVGKITSFKGPIGVSYDASGPDGEHYTLTLYLMGPNSLQWHSIEDDIERQHDVIEHLVRLVGSEWAANARDVFEYNSFVWKNEDYIHAGPILGFGPGAVSTAGPVFRQPFENIHIAGADTGDQWIDYLEGALISGKQAAHEVTAALCNI